MGRPGREFDDARDRTVMVIRASGRTLGETPPRMSPTIFHARGFRVYFFSREEQRPHVHVQDATGVAKFWLQPRIELAKSVGLRAQRIRVAQSLVEERFDEIFAAWKAYFGD